MINSIKFYLLIVIVCALDTEPAMIHDGVPLRCLTKRSAARMGKARKVVEKGKKLVQQKLRKGLTQSDKRKVKSTLKMAKQLKNMIRAKKKH